MREIIVYLSLFCFLFFTKYCFVGGGCGYTVVMRKKVTIYSINKHQMYKICIKFTKTP